MKHLKTLGRHIRIGISDRVTPVRYRWWMPRRWGNLSLALLVVILTIVFAGASAIGAARALLGYEEVVDASRKLAVRAGILASAEVNGQAQVNTPEDSAEIMHAESSPESTEKMPVPEQAVEAFESRIRPETSMIPKADPVRHDDIPNGDEPRQAQKIEAARQEVLEETGLVQSTLAEPQADEIRRRVVLLLAHYEQVQRDLAATGDESTSINAAINELRTRLDEPNLNKEGEGQ